MSANRELLAAAYAGFKSRRLEEVLALMSLNVDWPNGQGGGREIGRDAVRAYWTRQWAAIDPHVEPVGMKDRADGRVAVDVHQVVKDMEGNVLVDQMVVHVYRIDEGLIGRMDIE
jgi:hypothetical protein